MSQFVKIASGIDVAPLLGQVDTHSALWDEHPFRTSGERSPFRGTSDLWVRFRPLVELTEPRRFGEPHIPVWYPAADVLPALKPIVFDLMALVRSEFLGGILLTRIPSGVRIKPHHDRGSWHAEYFNRKVYVPLRSNEGCLNIAEGETAVMRPGEAWTFDNLVTHSVENNGEAERVTLIVCMRVE